MIADIFASELVMGGVHNWLEIFANNHRTHCNLSPTNAIELYNPKEEQLADVYVMEKIGTKQGWSNFSQALTRDPQISDYDKGKALY